MAVNTNRWNRFRYTFYTPIYDVIAGVFRNSREKSIGQLNIRPGEKVLIVGAGTGLDLEHIPKDCHVTATDLTPSMVEKIKMRSKRLDLAVDARVMDGQQMDFESEQFDHVFLHLILAVIPDPVACIREVERVLKPGGKVAVFDKFIAPGKSPSFFRRLLNVVTNVFFSNITRSVEKIVSKTSLRIHSDRPANFAGQFRIILLEKPDR